MRVSQTKRENVLNFLDAMLAPKENEKKRYSEVFTPIKIVQEMLSTLPHNVWKNSKLKWFDPCVGIGNFMVCVFYRLMEGLKKEFSDELERKNHIIRNMLYMSEINPLNVKICKKLFGSEANIIVADTLKENIPKYNIVLGNPPYNESVNGNLSPSPLYHKFTLKFIDNCDLLLFIIPSRWFNAGKCLSEFRQSMLQRTDIRYIKHINDSKEVFGSNITVKGGINYFLKDKNYRGKCLFNGYPISLKRFDVLVEYKDVKLVERMRQFKTITSIYIPSSYFRIQTNDERLSTTQNKILCHVSSKKGSKKYISSAEVQGIENFWKVLTPSAAHEHGSGFGRFLIAGPDEVFSQSFIAFRVTNKKQAISLVSYLQCELPNYLLSLRKGSQHINQSTCKWIPLVPLNQIWSNATLHAYLENHIKQNEEKYINGFIPNWG